MSREEKFNTRMNAIWDLKKFHGFNLRQLSIYINAKDKFNQPLHSDVTLIILPNPAGKMGKRRLQQILIRHPDYRINSRNKEVRVREIKKNLQQTKQT